MILQRKVMLLGDMAVGKTSIANRLAFDRFDIEYKSTLGMDIYRYDVRPSPSEEPFQFLIWDTDGNVSDTMLRSVYMKGAHAAVIVGDLTRRDTMLNQLQLAMRFIDEFPGRHLAAILNKGDLEGEIPNEDDHIPAGLRGASFPVHQTSAKTGDNVREAFADAAATIVRRKL